MKKQLSRAGIGALLLGSSLAAYASTGCCGDLLCCVQQLLCCLG